MVLIDVNVLVYAHRRDSQHHIACRRWLEGCINSEEAYGMSDLVLSAFLRIVTHPRIFKSPSRLEDALRFATEVRSPRGTGTFSLGFADRRASKAISSPTRTSRRWRSNQAVNGSPRTGTSLASRASAGGILCIRSPITPAILPSFP
jgi:predicted nucleic acid-binding protein